MEEKWGEREWDILFSGTELERKNERERQKEAGIGGKRQFVSTLCKLTSLDYGVANLVLHRCRSQLVHTP